MSRIHTLSDIGEGNKLGDLPSNRYPPSRTELENLLNQANQDREIAIECGNRLTHKCSILDKDNKRMQQDLNRSNKGKEKLSKHTYQLIDESKIKILETNESKEITALCSMKKILKCKLESTQKDNELGSKINEIERLKTKAIGGEEKNISAISEPTKSLAPYLVHKKNMEKSEKIINSPIHIDSRSDDVIIPDENPPIPEESESRDFVSSQKADIILESVSQSDDGIASVTPYLEQQKNLITTPIELYPRIPAGVIPVIKVIMQKMKLFLMDMDKANKHVASRCQSHPASPTWPFRMIVTGNSGSGKTNILANLFLGDKAEYIYKGKKGGRRYISCDDLIVCGYHPDEPKWAFVRYMYGIISKDLKAPYYENIRFSYISSEKIPNVKTFSPERSTAIVFEDLCLASEHIQNRIGQFFGNGRHRNISCIFVAQTYHKITTFMRENANYLVLFNSGSSYEDVSKIIRRYTDDVKNASMVINSYLRKGKFIVFDLDRPEDDPLAIRLRFDTPLD
ncbi:hypothetical protein C2G38_2221525 [Gigaspora rosea]|uniref:P-loop containing nucleoside triphosphate hydrolase protein n=1 Tax=Gigaspora rosea TaxID=44941 RepID=A0A397U6M3_9GLOM|nr:hypothetical protein C2G38_2221525 [Gigaspora rosea]